MLSTNDQDDAQSAKHLSMAQFKVLRLLVEKYAQTFLRKCIVLMHVRYGLDFESPHDLDLEAPEISRLTRLLHISSLDDLLHKFTSETAAGAQLHRDLF